MFPSGPSATSFGWLMPSARVVTEPPGEIPWMRLLNVSATYTVPSAATASPCGRLNRAYVVTAPVAASRRFTPPSNSETHRFPPESYASAVGCWNSATVVIVPNGSMWRTHRSPWTIPKPPRGSTAISTGKPMAARTAGPPSPVCPGRPLPGGPERPAPSLSEDRAQLVAARAEPTNRHRLRSAPKARGHDRAPGGGDDADPAGAGLDRTIRHQPRLGAGAPATAPDSTAAQAQLSTAVLVRSLISVPTPTEPRRFLRHSVRGRVPLRRRRRLHGQASRRQPGRRLHRRSRDPGRAPPAAGPGDELLGDGVRAAQGRRRARADQDLHPDDRDPVRRASDARNGVRARRSAPAGRDPPGDGRRARAGQARAGRLTHCVRTDGAADPDLRAVRRRGRAPRGCRRRAIRASRRGLRQRPTARLRRALFRGGGRGPATELQCSCRPAGRARNQLLRRLGLALEDSDVRARQRGPGGPRHRFRGRPARLSPRAARAHRVRRRDRDRAGSGDRASVHALRAGGRLGRTGRECRGRRLRRDRCPRRVPTTGLARSSGSPRDVASSPPPRAPLSPASDARMPRGPPVSRAGRPRAERASAEPAGRGDTTPGPWVWGTR